jgi:hypothetical protein
MKGGDEKNRGLFKVPLGMFVCFWHFLGHMPVEQLFGDNYKHLKISSVLNGDFRKQTHPL